MALRRHDVLVLSRLPLVGYSRKWLSLGVTRRCVKASQRYSLDDASKGECQRRIKLSRNRLPTVSKSRAFDSGTHQSPSPVRVKTVSINQHSRCLGFSVTFEVCINMPLKCHRICWGNEREGSWERFNQSRARTNSPTSVKCFQAYCTCDRVKFLEHSGTPSYATLVMYSTWSMN